MPARHVVSLRDWLTGQDGTSFTFRADQPLRYLASSRAGWSRSPSASPTRRRRDRGDDTVSLAIETNPRQTGADVDREAGRRHHAVLRGADGGRAVHGDYGGPGRKRICRAATAPAIRARQRAAAATRIRGATIRPRLPGSRILRRARARASVVGPGGRLEELPRAVAQRRVRAVFAALYAQKTRGDECSSTCCGSSGAGRSSESDQGPVYLGYRLGHIKEISASSARSSTTRARLCCTCCAGWWATRRSSAACAGSTTTAFQKAGTDDCERAIEEESGRALDRFFERWIYGTPSRG